MTPPPLQIMGLFGRYQLNLEEHGDAITSWRNDNLNIFKCSIVAIDAYISAYFILPIL